MRFLRGFALLSLIVALLAVPATASAAPPNDNRADAIRVTPPQTVTGTLVGSTLEPVGDVSECGTTDGSVWYRFTAPKDGVIIQLDANGEMDATVDVFERTRSRYDWFDCTSTDKKGIATLDTGGWESGAEYAIRIGNETGSVANTFTLRVLIPAQPPRPPGKKLPANGAKGSVDRLVDPGNAYWKRLNEGRTTKMYLGGQYCTSLSVYRPGTKSFSSQPVLRSKCGGYRLFTPDESGRYVFLVEAGRSRDVQRYRLQVERARADDTVPGIFIRNHAKVKGHVNGGIDSVDLYRFDVTRRSELTLRVSGGPDLELRSDGGGYLGGGSTIDRVVRPGRFFVAVEGQGKYQLSRVSRAVTNLSVQTKNKAFQKILLDVYDEVQAGKTLSEGLGKYPKVFNELFTSMVYVGEVSGNLEEILEILALQLEKEHDLLSKVRGAMIYPSVIVVAMIGIGILMLTYILPRITSVFKDMNVTLPASTRFIMVVSDFMRGHALMSTAIFFGSIIGVRLFASTTIGKRFFDWFFLRLPIVGNIIIKVNSARFARIYSSLLKSGVSVLDSLTIVKKTLSNLYYRDALDDAISEIQKGVDLSKVISRYPRIFPVLVPQIIQVGEETGKTEMVLRKLAEFYEEEVSQITKNMSSIIEPVLMLLIGGGVGFFAVAMLTPMYSVMENIK